MAFAGMTEVVPVLEGDKFEVLGSDMQILNVKVKAGEVIQSVPGGMAYMDPSMKMAVNTTDCSGRCLSGSSPIMATYTNEGSGDAILGLTPSFPAKIIPLPLSPGVVYRAKVRCR